MLSVIAGIKHWRTWRTKFSIATSISWSLPLGLILFIYFVFLYVLVTLHSRVWSISVSTLQFQILWCESYCKWNCIPVVREMVQLVVLCYLGQFRVFANSSFSFFGGCFLGLRYWGCIAMSNIVWISWIGHQVWPNAILGISKPCVI